MTSISVIGLVLFAALLCFQCPEQLVECQDPPADGAKLGKVATNFLHGDYDEEFDKLKGIQKIGKALGFGGGQPNKGNPDSRYYYPPENNPHFKAADAPSPDADPDANPESGSGGPKGPAKAGPEDPSPEDDNAAGGPEAGKGKGADDPDGADYPKGASDPDADADDTGGGADKGGKSTADGDTSGKDQDLKGRGEGDEEEEGGGKSDDEDSDGKGAKGDEEEEGSGEEEGSPEEEGEDEKDPDVPLVVPPKIPRHKPKRVNVPLRLFLLNVQRYGFKAAKYPYASRWPNMYGKYGRTRSAKKRGGSRRRSRQRKRGYGYGYGYGRK